MVHELLLYACLRLSNMREEIAGGVLWSTVYLRNLHMRSYASARSCGMRATVSYGSYASNSAVTCQVLGMVIVGVIPSCYLLQEVLLCQFECSNNVLLVESELWAKYGRDL